MLRSPEGPDHAARQEVIEALDRVEGVEQPSASSPASAPSASTAAPHEGADPAVALEPAVQRILSEGLRETYVQLPPALQARFKAEGERTASTIAKLLTEVKVQVGRIIVLIRRWLAIIPGVNRYYLEQEAKLKADAVLALRRPPQP